MRFSPAVLGLALLLLSACGGSGDEAAAPGGGAESSSPHEHSGNAQGECADLTGSGQATVVMKDDEFVPACFTVSSEQGLQLRNDGAALHSFSMENVDLDFDVQAGEFTNTEPIGQVLEAGTYDYHCKYHPAMTGEITVATK